MSATSRDEIHRRLDSFRAHWLRELDQWKEQGVTGEEQKAAQRFWIDLFSCFGVSAARMNLFERNARRGSTGGAGRIDLFYPSVVIGEAKKPGVSLEVAYEQALDYLNGGTVRDFEMPRYVLCSNFEQFRLVRLGDVGFDISFSLSEVTDNLDALKFLAGYDTVTKREEERASIRASQLMAELFTAMAGDDVDEAVGDEAPTNYEDEELRVHETSMYLTRLLFLLFGDDAGLWEQDLFTRFVEENTTADNLGPQLNALFEVLNTPENRRGRVPDSLASFPYVNGAVFSEQMRTQYFDAEMRDALLKACRFNWSEISPAIFGSLFQLVKSKEARRSDGEHYTSETNILKTLEPLFLDELRKEAERLITSRSTTVKALRAFRDSLADYAFLDPACGSGNFLIVAYRELRKIETDLIVEIRKREGTLDELALDVSFEQKLSIGQFFGIELNWWPARIAETAMFLVDHQSNQELAQRIGAAPERLPISITAHIHHANALAVDWSRVVPKPRGETIVFGNPPFLGHDTRSKEQSEELRTAWRRKDISRLDYVTGWHAQALTMLENRRGRFGFVTTNSISQGDQVPRLFGPIFDAGWRIRFAHRTFAWDSEAPGKAAVHCVIVGFDRGCTVAPRLWDYETPRGLPKLIHVEKAINGYLVDGPNVLVKSSSTPISAVVEPAAFGNTPRDGGHLIVEQKDYESFSQDAVASKYLHRFMGARELLHGKPRWCLWLVNVDPVDVFQSALLKERIEETRKWRTQSKAKQAQDAAAIPHLFWWRSHPGVDYLCIPSVVSEKRRYFTAARNDADVISSNLVFTVPDESGLMFSLVSSSMFMTWQRTVGGRLKSDLRFSNTLVWNSFPVPGLTDKQRTSIIRAGEKVLETRARYPERSLAEHYAPLSMDPDLVKAHDALDREVDKAFGASRKLTNERQRLELLFRNYEALTSD